jgi:hypothetical protein
MRRIYTYQMTKDIIHNEVDKDLEKILNSLVDKNGVCRACGQDHSFRPSFQDTKTSIDALPRIFREYQKSEITAEVTM